MIERLGSLPFGAIRLTEEFFARRHHAQKAVTRLRRAVSRRAFAKLSAARLARRAAHRRRAERSRTSRASISRVRDPHRALGARRAHPARGAGAHPRHARRHDAGGAARAAGPQSRARRHHRRRARGRGRGDARIEARDDRRVALRHSRRAAARGGARRARRSPIRARRARGRCASSPSGVTSSSRTRRTCKRLALTLFDALGERLGCDAARIATRLSDAALLHDAGYHISYERHHKHSYHLILHADLLGMSPAEQVVIANVARYHRGGAAEEDAPQLRRARQDAAAAHQAAVGDPARGRRLRSRPRERGGATSRSAGCSARSASRPWRATGGRTCVSRCGARNRKSALLAKLAGVPVEIVAPDGRCCRPTAIETRRRSSRPGRRLRRSVAGRRTGCAVASATRGDVAAAAPRVAQQPLVRRAHRRRPARAGSTCRRRRDPTPGGCRRGRSRAASAGATCSAGSSTGATASTRRSKLRGIQSAEPR